MSKPVTFASPDSNNPLRAAYEAYVKRNVEKGAKPLNPDEWFELVQVVEGIKTGFQMPKLVPDGKHGDDVVYKVDFKNEEARKLHEEAVRDQFIAMMIDNGISKTLTLYERARHSIELGEERSMSVRQTTPCVMCGDILCRWAR